MTITEQVSKRINFLDLRGRWLWAYHFFLAFLYGGALLVSIGVATDFFIGLSASDVVELLGAILVLGAGILLWPILINAGSQSRGAALREELRRARSMVSTLERSNEELRAGLSASTDEVRNAMIRQSLLLRKFDVAAFRCDLEHRYTWSENCWLGNEAVVGKSDEDLFPPAMAREIRSLKERALEDGGVHETRLCLKSETGARIVGVQVMGVRDESGKLIGTAIVSCDITEQSMWRDHLSLLLKEVNHRSRNILAILSAICSLSGASAASAEAFQKQMKGRIDCLARTMDLLAGSNWSSASMQEIVHRQLQCLPDTLREGIEISGPEVQLKPKAVQSLGLVIHELATNALYHGLLSSGTANVQISWKLSGPDQQQKLEFFWREVSVVAGGAASQRGFGQLFLERLASAEVDGKSQYNRTAAGVTYKLEVSSEHVCQLDSPAVDATNPVGRPFDVDNVLREEFNRLLLATASRRLAA
jgi:two-component sensor histidine kinase